MTCRTCDCADKAADTDEWVTFAKRPVEARLTAERDALQVGRDRDRVTGHKCEPYYSRSECGQCGWQEQWCATCSRQMCGCATGATDQDAMGADQ